MDKPPPPDDFDDNPEWTEEDFARARPVSEILPPHVVAALMRKAPLSSIEGAPLSNVEGAVPGDVEGNGRPRASAKQQVSLRLDRDVLDRFRAAGPGWQTRINEALRRAAP